MIGETLDGKYTILHLLGEGGMGAVYEGRNDKTGRRVAVKVINSSAAKKPNSIKRFTREIEVVGAIETQHIVQVLDAGQDPRSGCPYMVMELLAGQDVQQLIQRIGPLAPDLALRIAAQACLGLAKAHGAGIVHRDIKPANLFLARRDAGEVIVKVLDFGIAKTLLGDPARERLTATGVVLGSPLYMSPEQIKGQGGVDQRTDVWSIGAVLYEALSGVVPYYFAETIHQLVMSICTSSPNPLQDLAPWVPPEAVGVVWNAMQHDVERRFQTAIAMVESIERMLPQGWSIHERMLVPLASEARAVIAVRAALNPSVSQAESSAAAPEISSAPQIEAQSSVLPRSAPSGRRGSSALVFAGAGAALLGASIISVNALNSHGGVSTLSPVGSVITEKAPEPSSSVPHTVRVMVNEVGASVEVDGVAAVILDGSVEVSGALGSVHKVKIVSGNRETVARVVITSDGALPAWVELGSVPLPTASPAASLPQFSAGVQPSGTRRPSSGPLSAPPAVKAPKGVATRFE